MKVSSTELPIIGAALGALADDFSNRVATCPDVFEYEQEIAVLRAHVETVRALERKVLRAIDRTTLPNKKVTASYVNVAQASTVPTGPPSV